MINAATEPAPTGPWVQPTPRAWGHFLRAHSQFTTTNNPTCPVHNWADARIPIKAGTKLNTVRATLALGCVACLVEEATHASDGRVW